jgi:hypothetical protein
LEGARPLGICGINNHIITIIALHYHGIGVPLSERENHRMELAMPDLDLIKQAEQVCGTGARLPRAALAIPTAGSAPAATKG